MRAALGILTAACVAFYFGRGFGYAQAIEDAERLFGLNDEVPDHISKQRRAAPWQ